jgi:pyruvate dehydrogenase E1 component alpha subunit
MLRQAGVAEAELEADREAAKAEMQAAYEKAVATPYPPAKRAFHDVQDIGDPRVEAY